jgi:cyanocobalamin reductase (cyanide-eliminating) / alkylcobalamin dealkylase
MMSAFEPILEALRASVTRAGFDLVQPLRVGWYNDIVAAPLRLEDFGSGEHLALLVGNTRALWPVFLDALSRDAELGSSSDPLDLYTERCLGAAVGAIAQPSSVRFGHDTGERLVALQRLAHVAGLAHLTETHASVHPEYGPWLALRAVVSVAVEGPPGPPPSLPHPCGSCARGCQAAFERACATLVGTSPEENLRAHWQRWLECRDACPVGREHRYSEAQIRYHYVKDPASIGRQRASRKHPAQRN